MKQNSRIRGILILIILLIPFSRQSLCQENVSPLELLNATIVNEEGDVQLQWRLLTDTIEFDTKIERDDIYIEAFVPIHIITDTSTKTWVDTNSYANSQIRAYW